MINRIRIINTALYTASGVIFVVLAIFLFLLFHPLAVIKNWVIVIQPGSYKIGDSIAVQSTYDKIRNVTGQATRSLECTSDRVASARYPLSQAKADHPAGAKTGTGIIAVIPPVPVPSVCRVAIDLDYGFGNAPAHAKSGTFNVDK